MAEWVILELGPMAEGEDPSLITASIRHLVGKDAEVFIPAVITQVGEDRVVTYLVDGYAFIRRSRPDPVYFRLDETRYVRNVVRDFMGGKSRSPACIQDRDIEKFKRQIRLHSDQGIGVGDTVHVMSGPYKSLQAVVIEDIPEQDSVQVRIELRSKDSLVVLPRSFLRLNTKAALPPYVVRVRDHRDWFDRALPLLNWVSDKFEPIIRLYSDFNAISRCLQGKEILGSYLRFDSSPDTLATMRETWTQYSSLNKWMLRGTRLHSFIRSFDAALDPEPLDRNAFRSEQLNSWEVKYRQLTQHLELVEKPLLPEKIGLVSAEMLLLDSTVVRFLDLVRSVNSIERTLEGDAVIENIVIDGMNMVVRCSMAPGLGSLRDSKGRPTGAIVGFLNSISSLRKKHPKADIWVCWDSPSNRRRAVFSDYKANRNPLRHTFEVSWLRAVLPLFGVWQASVEGEEADDVVASLVRGRLEWQRNLIVSNDRDFMQLVTETTHVLVPAVGSAKERTCTPDVVQAEYGVPPDRMVHLRALGGDTSDNIPGAPGCGNKTAGKLLQLYGTVEGIFTSNLAGLSSSLRDKLRGAEKQVRLNLSLMSLVSDLELSLQAPAPDQTVAAQHLDDIEMNPSRVMPIFFGSEIEVAA